MLKIEDRGRHVVVEQRAAYWPLLSLPLLLGALFLFVRTIVTQSAARVDELGTPLMLAAVGLLAASHPFRRTTIIDLEMGRVETEKQTIFRRRRISFSVDEVTGVRIEQVSINGTTYTLSLLRGESPPVTLSSERKYAFPPRLSPLLREQGRRIATLFGVPLEETEIGSGIRGDPDYVDKR